MEREDKTCSRDFSDPSGPFSDSIKKLEQMLFRKKSVEVNSVIIQWILLVYDVQALKLNISPFYFVFIISQ